jgi:hypothetical protein
MATILPTPLQGTPKRPPSTTGSVAGRCSPDGPARRRQFLRADVVDHAGQVAHAAVAVQHAGALGAGFSNAD